MIRRFVVVAGWVLATLVATAVAFGAVRSVAGQVVESPASQLLDTTTTSQLAAQGDSTTASTSLSTPATTTSVTATSAATDATTTTTTIDEATSATAVSTTVAGGGTTSTTEGPDDGSTTSTTVDDDDDDDDDDDSTTGTSSTTSTTEAPAATQTATYSLVGGWVRIVYGAGVVNLDGAGPNPGYTMTIDDAGPGQVDVTFRNDDHRSDFNAEWEGGELRVDIDEEDEGD